MKKKMMALVLAFVCAAGAFSAVTTVEHPVTMEAATKKKAPSINQVYSAVKKAYGNKYLPNYRLNQEPDKDEIKIRYGISKSWYTSAIAEVPMITAHADELVIVKAKNTASKKKIKSALLSYQKQLKNDTLQYPQNQLKIQASRVYVKGDYVCFFVLGSISNSQADQADESKVIAAYKAETAKAVKAIQKLYK